MIDGDTCFYERKGGLNCPIKKGNVKWVLHRFACDIAVLEELKLEEVGCQVVVSLWGQCCVQLLFLPSMGHSGGIIIIWDPDVLELVDLRIASFSVCYKFKSLLGNFVWGLIGVDGPNDDNVRSALFEELVTFMSNWDIPWCLGGGFNVVRFPSQRSTGGRLNSAMIEFSDFIGSYNLIDPPLEGGCFTCSSHEEVPMLSRIDWFLLSSE